MSEFDTEPVPGLPEQLPEGERLRWQGAPKWAALAVRALACPGPPMPTGSRLVELVAPTTTIAPDGSTARSCTRSMPLPPA